MRLQEAARNLRDLTTDTRPHLDRYATASNLVVQAIRDENDARDLLQQGLAGEVSPAARETPERQAAVNNAQADVVTARAALHPNEEAFNRNLANLHCAAVRLQEAVTQVQAVLEDVTPHFTAANTAATNLITSVAQVYTRSNDVVHKGVAPN